MRSTRYPTGPRPSSPHSANPEGGKPRVRTGSGSKPEFSKTGGKSAPNAAPKPFREGPRGESPRPKKPPHGEARPTSARPAAARPAAARTDTARTDVAPAEAPRTSNRLELHRSEIARSPGTGSGGHWLYGLHAVVAAMKNPARRLRRLLLTEEGAAALAIQVATPWAIGPEAVERSRIDHLLGREAVHQGIALLADALPSPSLQQVVERSGPILILDQVTDPRNVGAILRSAAAFGAAAVVLQDRNAPEETGALAKAASGALELVPVLRAVNLVRTMVALKAAGFWCVGLDARAKPLIGGDFKQRRVALILGAEGEGMRRLTRENCDELAALAMSGSMESLNVSAAATVALYEMSRGR